MKMITVDLRAEAAAEAHRLTAAREWLRDGDQQALLRLESGGAWISSARRARLRRALSPRGTLVIVGGEGRGRWIGMDRQLRALALSPFVGQRLTMLGPKEHYTVRERLTGFGWHKKQIIFERYD